MAKTEIQEVGSDIAIRQSWLLGFRSTTVLVLRQGRDAFYVSPEVSGVTLNGKALTTRWDRYPLTAGDTVGLPHGGTFEITADVLSGKNPIIVP